MNSRDCVLDALAHRKPERVPMDFGSTAVSGMHVTCVEALREYYGLEKRPVRAYEPYQMLGLVEEDLLGAMGVDVAGVPSRNTLFGFPNENWKEFRAPWGQVLFVSEHFNVTVEENGDLLIYPAGDIEAPPSGRMPDGGYFFDSIIRQQPIDEDRLDPADNVEEFSVVSDNELEWMKDRALRLRDTGRAVVASVAGTAFGDIALVPAPFMKNPRGIRDVTEWYVSTVMRPEYVREVFSRQCDMALQSIEKAAAVLGDLVDVLFVCGTDFGTQTSTFCSIDVFRDLYKPFYSQVNDCVHRLTSWKTFKHSCGAVTPFIDDMIDAGFDILNPVQCSASGMDPVDLKKRFGNRLTFWGGGVDTQKTLPFGTPEQVRAQVLERCSTFADQGGFVFNAIHNVQARTPVQNIVAMLDAVKEFNGVL